MSPKLGRLLHGGNGKLGYGSTTSITITAGDVPVGGTATGIAAGTSHTCALLDTGALRCWGLGANGQLGYDAVLNIGDGTGLSIIAAGDVPVF